MRREGGVPRGYDLHDDRRRPRRSVSPGREVTAQLITIPFSHYCEKARWALDRCGVALRGGRPPPAVSLPRESPRRRRPHRAGRRRRRDAARRFDRHRRVGRREAPGTLLPTGDPRRGARARGRLRSPARSGDAPVGVLPPVAAHGSRSRSSRAVVPRWQHARAQGRASARVRPHAARPEDRCRRRRALARRRSRRRSRSSASGCATAGATSPAIASRSPI